VADPDLAFNTSIVSSQIPIWRNYRSETTLSHRLQIGRIGKARGSSENFVRKRVNQKTNAPIFAFIGERRVDVPLLDMALDQLSSP
jgi:K+-transporting ATPase, c chain